MKLYNFTFAFLIIALAITGCSGQNDNNGQQNGEMAIEQGNHTGHTDMKMDSGEPTDESIYNVSSSWKNRHDEQMQLADLSGKVQVLAMVYTHCEHACPRILADLERIQDQLSVDELNATNFVIVSIDPERDTPERLYNFAEENNLSEQQWTLLNGGQGDVLELAALLGVKYKRISETDFTHSNIITVLNKQGEIVHQRTKLGDQPTDIVNAIKKVAS